MSREHLIQELREINGVLRGNHKHTAYHRARNYRAIDFSAVRSDGNTEINAAMTECWEMRQEDNALVARRNEILEELVGVQP